jgi:enoyl-[acyl-carrier protein] reductase I
MADSVPASIPLLEGKKGLIVGVANQHSIAWAVAQALHAAGMELALTYQGEALRERVRRTTSILGEVPLFDLDVQSDEQIERVLGEVANLWDRLDFLLHSVAYAPREALSQPFVETSREAFRMAQDISAYSLVGLTRAAAPLMADGGSVVTLTYYGAEKVVPGYNVMGVAKASLEACVRYLAFDLGEKNIRVNAISAGPLNTLAARGIANFRDMLRMAGERAPLRRTIDVSEVGKAALFLASDLASGMTGEVMYVDAGYNVMAL